MPTTYNRELIETLRVQAAEAQAAFWEALTALELGIGVVIEDLGLEDLENHDVDSLIALAEDTGEEDEEN